MFLHYILENVKILFVFVDTVLFVYNCVLTFLIFNISNLFSYSTSNKVAEPESKAKPVTGCKIAATKSIDTTEEKSRTLFLPNNWRQEVCKCDDCLKLLEAENLSFLIDEEDTVHFYESQAKAEEGNFQLLHYFLLDSTLNENNTPLPHEW